MNAIERFRRQARATLSREIWDYLEQGADDGVTAARAEDAWHRQSLRPRVLRGVAQADTASNILGQPVALPIMIAPNGRATRFHPDGERELLSGAAAAGAITVLPSSVLPSLAPLRAHCPEALVWQQLYMAADRTTVRDRLGAAAQHGCRAVVLTADLLPGGVSSPPAPPAAPWELAESADAGGVAKAASLDDLAWLCTESTVPVVVKGVLRGDDAELCLAAGAAALIVSNHGGNQLDTSISSAEALEEVASACRGKAEVYVDGGIRRGTSVLKALALGAAAVLIGRPGSYALAAAGARGVTETISGLGAELRRAMALCGAATLAEVDRSLVARLDSVRS